MEGLGRRLDRSSATGRAVLDWEGPPDALGDAVPLRLAGALHGLVRAGRLPALAKLYPPNPLPGTTRLADAAMEALQEADSEIMAWLRFAPQTNEAARSAVLYPGLMVVAAKTGLPLALFEVGASAGLNLIPERYAYNLGGRRFGDRNSPVVLSPKWSGELPTDVEPHILSRRGCDLNPIDVTDASQRARLIAYVWADQQDRLARVEAAIALLGQDPPDIDAADAADWVCEMVEDNASKGVGRVLYHSIAFQYFPTETKQRIAAGMEMAGRQATAQSPLAWLAFEQREDQGVLLTLRLWPGGKEDLLAQGEAQGREVRWRG